MKKTEKILVIRLREIGDTILLTPLLRQLKRIYPEAVLDVVCEDRNAVVLQHNPHVNRLFRLQRKANAWRFLKFSHELRRENYDLAIDSQSMPKTALLTRLTCSKTRLGFKNRWLRNRLCYTAPFVKETLLHSAVSNLQLLQDDRVDLKDVELDVFATPEAQRATEWLTQEAKGRPVVAINPATRFEARRWSYDGFAEIADRLSTNGYKVLILYGPGEKEIAQGVAHRMHQPCLIEYPIPTLLELRCLLSKCVLYVGNDGGPKHLAVASGISTVTLFGDSPDPWTPWSNPRHRVIASARAGESIHACGEIIPYASSIHSIPVESVWRQVELSLSSKRQAAS